MRFYKKITVLGGIFLALAGCGNPKDTPQNPQNEPANTAQSPNAAQEAIAIDWQALQTGVKKANLDDYPYPFAEDSTAVQNYAQSYHISPKQAQHSMMLAMASPEALGKVLDQLQGHYRGHYLTDGADMRLVILTSNDVAASNFDYVFADKFGEGLVLPIVVVPKSQAQQLSLADSSKIQPATSPETSQ